MKVLHIIDSLGMGGAQTLVKGIFEKQKESKNIFLFALRKREMTTKINHKNVIIYNSKLRYSLVPIFNLKRVIEEEYIGILHCHLLRSQVFGLVLKKLFFPKLQLIFHEHGEIFRKKPQFILFLKLYEKDVDLFIAVSEATKQRLIEDAAIPEEKIKILHNFVDLDQFDPEKTAINRLEERRKRGICGADFVIGFAGRHVERKGCRELIRAIGELHDRENIKLLIAGDGPKKEEYMELVTELGLNQNIFFLGYIPDIRYLYSIIDCFVVPSHWEPLGIVALEAHAIGVPVIAADVGGLNEVVSDTKTGLLFEPKKEKDIAEKIILLYTDKMLRETMIKSGSESVKEYSLNTYLTNIENIYQEVVKWKI